MGSATIDLYETLGVEAAASAAEIRSAYRRRSREIHPDRNASADANRRMAELNEAYAVLSDPDRRSEYDARRPKARLAPRPVSIVPAEGRGALQPERLPDWYEFLDLRMDASSAEIIAAANRLGQEVRLANYTEEDETRLLAQLKQAVELLTNPALRRVYDAALCGTPPPAGTFPHLHENWYTFLGVGPAASYERIAERVTGLSGRMRMGSPEYRELVDAWRTLRDPELRAAYNRELGLGA